MKRDEKVHYIINFINKNMKNLKPNADVEEIHVRVSYQNMYVLNFDFFDYEDTEWKCHYYYYEDTDWDKRISDLNNLEWDRYLFGIEIEIDSGIMDHLTIGGSSDIVSTFEMDFLQRLVKHNNKLIKAIKRKESK